MLKMKIIIRNLPVSPTCPAMTKAVIFAREACRPSPPAVRHSHTQYGILLATLPAGRHLSHDQQQLVDTLVEQLTATLALDRHQEKQQQLIVMEERATIARELHDSIAQSLSCMKMQVSCLQMQDAEMPESNKQLLSQIRNELNTSWIQLRELLTTFRLQLTEPGLPSGDSSTADRP